MEGKGGTRVVRPKFFAISTTPLSPSSIVRRMAGRLRDW
jgi:hypothetical protein